MSSRYPDSISFHDGLSFEDSDLKDPVRYTRVLIGIIHGEGVLPPVYKINALIRGFDYYSFDRMTLFTQLISALGNYRDFTPFAVTLLEKITADFFARDHILELALRYINPAVLSSSVVLDCFAAACFAAMTVDLRRFQILIHAGFLRNLNTMHIKIVLDTVASYTGHVLLRPITELIMSGDLNCEISLDKNVKIGCLTYFFRILPGAIRSAMHPVRESVEMMFPIDVIIQNC